MRPAWTQFWASAGVLLLLGLPKAGSVRAALAQHHERPHRANELTLAELRPGRDDVAKAMRLYKRPLKDGQNSGDWVWVNGCTKERLVVNMESSKTIQEIRVSHQQDIAADCDRTAPRQWKTGRGLKIGDPASKVLELYGEPSSKSPSLRGDQPLELLYYAFDWAGPNVPQVMEVSCTPEKEGRPGRVVEMMLAAPSL